MKVGIYDPYLDDLGGGEKYMMTLVSCLSKNHEVGVFWDREEDFKKIQERFGIDFTRIEKLPNIFSGNYSLFSRFKLTQKFDAIFILSDGSIPLLGSKKLFLHIQQPLANFQTSIWGKLKLSRVTRIFCNSMYTKKYLEQRYLLHPLVIYPPVEVFRSDSKKENIILHVGRFRVTNVGVEDYKKQSIMVEAFKNMVDNGLVGWKFVVVSSVAQKDMDRFKTLEEKAKGYKVEFLVNKSSKTLQEIYSKAKIYWHASGYGEDLEKNPQFAEHFGISTVEAMSAGVVPVVINAGGQKEIVKNEENGMLWDSLEELEKKTFDLAKNEDLFKKLSLSAQKRALDFSKEKFCEEVNHLLQ